MVAHVAHATMFLMLIGTVLAILFALITAVAANLGRRQGLSRTVVAATLIIIAAALVIAAAALVIIAATLVIVIAALVVITILVIIVRGRGNGGIVGKEWI